MVFERDIHYRKRYCRQFSIQLVREILTSSSFDVGYTLSFLVECHVLKELTLDLGSIDLEPYVC
jgi:hypothetical protein